MCTFEPRLEIKTKGLDLLLSAVKECGELMRMVEARVEIYGPDYEGEHAILRKMIDQKQKPTNTHRVHPLL